MRTKNKCALSLRWESCCGVWEEKMVQTSIPGMSLIWCTSCAGRLDGRLPSVIDSSDRAHPAVGCRLTADGSALLTLPSILYTVFLYRRRLCASAVSPSSFLPLPTGLARRIDCFICVPLTSPSTTTQCQGCFIIGTRNWCRACPGLCDPTPIDTPGTDSHD